LPASLPATFQSGQTWENQMGMGAFDVAVAFWVFVAIAAGAGIVGDVLKRRYSLEPLRLAIGKGQQLDPKLVEKLMTTSQRAEQVEPANLMIAGVITGASGIGVALLSWFLSQLVPRALYPTLGAGVVTVCVGIGLYVAGRLLERQRKQQDAADR